MLNRNALVQYHMADTSLRLLIDDDIQLFSKMIPDWVRDFHICHLPIDDDRPITTAAVNVEYAYWKLTLTVYDRYFVKSLDERRGVFLHEMLHAHIAPLTEYYSVFEEDADEKLTSLGEKAEERAIEGITYMVLDLLK